MKNTILSFALLFFCGSLFAQADVNMPSMEETVASFTNIYNLDAEQQKEMVKIQERKFRNLGEIEGMKTSDPKKYQQKISAMHTANMKHMHDLLNEEQLKTFRQKQVELRKKKAELFQEMKGSSTSQADIEMKMTELDVDALLNG